MNNNHNTGQDQNPYDSYHYDPFDLPPNAEDPHRTCFDPYNQQFDDQYQSFDDRNQPFYEANEQLDEANEPVHAQNQQCYQYGGDYGQYNVNDQYAQYRNYISGDSGNYGHHGQYDKNYGNYQYHSHGHALQSYHMPGQNVLAGQRMLAAQKILVGQNIPGMNDSQSSQSGHKMNSLHNATPVTSRESANSKDSPKLLPNLLPSSEHSETPQIESNPGKHNYQRLQIPQHKLNTGASCPGLAYGTGGEGNATPEELYHALTTAIKAGYRSFDTAPFYLDGGVEFLLGRAIRESGVARDQFFITTKVWPTFSRCPMKSVQMSLRSMQLEYIDCLLLHWPIPLIPVPGEPYAMGDTWDTGWNFNETWAKMQEIPHSVVRAIGVCNFTTNRLRLLLNSSSTTVIPAVLEVEGHPELPQQPLMRFCQEQRIQIFCFSPLAKGQINNKILQKIARKHDVSPGQVAISWAVQRGTVPLPKSVNSDRIRANISLVTLDKEDMALLADLGKNPRRIVNPRILFGHDIFENNADSYDKTEVSHDMKKRRHK